MIVIIGSGYAGAATAWALARRGHGARVVLVEAEASTARHSSALNAGLIGSLFDEEPLMVAMSVAGSRLLAETFGARGELYRPCGSIRLAAEANAERVAALARRHDLSFEMVPAAGLARREPYLAGGPSPVALRFPQDAAVDPAGLARAYLAAASGAGARVVTSARVHGLVFSCGKVAGVRTDAGDFTADWIVLAAGAWSGGLADSITHGRAADLGLTPYRRHIFESGPLPGVRPDGPFVWDMDHDVYYRPAGDRLWLCACDEEPHPPGSPEPEPGAEAALREKLAAAFPALARVELPSARACLRTFAPDRRYVIGPDPALPGLFWVAGLGGSGATAGAAVGELAAERLLRGGGPVDAGAYPETAFDPVRFAGGAPTLEAES